MVSPSLSPRQQAIQFARRVIEQDPIFLDTETTGLGNQDEIIEISVVDDLGETIFQSLVKSTQPIPPSSMQVHGISNEDIQKSPPWPIVWMQLRPILVNRFIVAYNSDFDLRMMQQSHARYRQTWKDNLRMVDLLKIYAQFRGEWDDQKRGWKYVSLSMAGKECGITLPNAHRAAADSLLTRALLHHIAEA